MKIYVEDPSEYDLKGMLWSGAEKALEEIMDADRFDEFCQYIDDVYSDGIGLTELNDILRFDFEQLKKDIGMFDLEDEIDENSLKKFQDEMIDSTRPRAITNSEMKDYDLLSTGEASESDLSDQISEITSKLSEISDAVDEIFDCEDMDELEAKKEELTDFYNELRDLLDEYVDENSKVYKDLYNFDIDRFFYSI